MTSVQGSGGGTVSREWVMPSKWTFTMLPVQALLRRYMNGGEWIDPFAGENSPATVRNDIEGRGNEYQLDGLEFLRSRADGSADGALFDPPYSTEQALRKYTPKQGGTAGRAEYWTRCKDEIARILRPGGTAICFGWDSTGLGKSRGFALIEVKLLCHGACHNDTIITVERMTQGRLPL